MAAFLLIHGSNHGAWCWEDVLPHLTAAGHDARAIDLPACGADTTPAGEVTLADNVAAILDALDGPTVLVGHSLAGISITAAAEAAPERIAKLIFVAAWAPRDGQSARDLRLANGCEALVAATRISEDRLTSSFADAAVEQLFYHDCPPGTLDRARPRLRPQPLAIASERVTLTGRGLSVPRAYIRCLADRAIPPAYQVAASADWPETRDMSCAHSPFFAQPETLANHLTELAP